MRGGAGQERGGGGAIGVPKRTVLSGRRKTQLGSEAFVRRELGRKRVVQDQLLSRLPAVGDLQSAWLLLLFCASPRANYLLRMLPCRALATPRASPCALGCARQLTQHPPPTGPRGRIVCRPFEHGRRWQPTAWPRRYSPRLRPLRPLQLPVTPPPIFASRATMPPHGPRCSRGSRRPGNQTATSATF